MRRPEPRVICVVVPAHDEQLLLPGALQALGEARADAGVDVEVVVVANGCRDRTADIAREHGVEVIERDQANVGLARSAGFAHILDRHARRLSEVWFASTDADSRVPLSWFASQRAAATAGADVYLGTVAVADQDRRGVQRWIDAYDERARRGAVHGHVHGANFGVRALVYQLAGGFTSLAVGEDVDLVDRLVQRGASVAWCTASPVVTSVRRVGKAPGGVASDISRCIEAVSLHADGAA